MDMSRSGTVSRSMAFPSGEVTGCEDGVGVGVAVAVGVGAAVAVGDGTGVAVGLAVVHATTSTEKRGMKSPAALRRCAAMAHSLDSRVS